MEQDHLMLDLDNISFSYPNVGKILDNLSFQLTKGERAGLIGPNGSGKSTLLNIIMGLLSPESGSIRIFGKPVETEQDFKAARQGIGFLFQNSDDQLFSPTVIEDIAFGPLNMGKTPDEAMAMSLELLKKLQLEKFEDRITYKLSGGEKKLVSLATVLVMEPKMMLLDEPTTGLDPETMERIIGILNDLDITYLIVSHEYDFLTRTTAKIYCMECGTIIDKCESSSLHDHFRYTGTIVYGHEHSR
jgi:cobalt/nickel transport system ATP-binding protein